MIFTNKKQIKDKLDDIAKKSLEQVAIKVREAWMGYIDTEFYRKYAPKEYQRTDQMYNSICKIVSTNIYETPKGWGIDIFMDESMITNRTGNHYNIPIQDVFTMSAEGWHGNTRTEGRFFEAILNDLENGKIRNEFEKILKNMGLKLTVSRK